MRAPLRPKKKNRKREREREREGEEEGGREGEGIAAQTTDGQEHWLLSRTMLQNPSLNPANR